MSKNRVKNVEFLNLDPMPSILLLLPLPGGPAGSKNKVERYRLNLLLVLALPPLPGVQPSQQEVEDVKGRLNLLL